MAPKAAAWIAVVALLAVPTVAQTPAGGNWTHRISEDKFSGEKSEVFRILASEPLSDGPLSGTPVFDIMCRNEKWLDSYLVVPVILGNGDWKSALGIPQMGVWMRHDGKKHYHFWNIAPDRKTMFADKGSTRDLLNASDVRIQFADINQYEQVALFNPSGIDRVQLNRACGEKTFH